MAVSTPNLYPVRLTCEGRAALEVITRNGRNSAKKIRRAQVLLWSDVDREGGRLSSREIAERLGLHDNSVDRIRKQFVQEGEAAALERKVRESPPVSPKIDGHVEAQLIAICCGPAPEGRVRWTLTLLASELKRKGLVTGVCAETVRKTLKKTSCSLGGSSAGAFPNGTRPGSSHRWKTSSTSTPHRTRTKSR
jgi:transposase